MPVRLRIIFLHLYPLMRKRHNLPHDHAVHRGDIRQQPFFGHHRVICRQAARRQNNRLTGGRQQCNHIRRLQIKRVFPEMDDSTAACRDLFHPVVIQMHHAVERIARGTGAVIAFSRRTADEQRPAHKQKAADNRYQDH